MYRFLLLFLIGLQAFAGENEIVLRVRPHLIVEPNTEVRLSDLVQAEGLSPATHSRLGKVAVIRAQGERQDLSDTSLLEVLRPIVQEEKKQTTKKVQLVIPKRVVIETRTREFRAETVKEELLQAWQPLCADCRLEFNQLKLPAVGEVKDWRLHVKAELPRGSFSVPVEVSKESGARIQAWVSGRLVLEKKVPVARRMISINEIPEKQDFEWVFRDVSYAVDGVPTEQELSERRLKRSVRANDIIWASYLEREKAIRRGDPVVIRSGEGPWEVSLTLIAQQDAHIGDVISFKNPKTNTVLTGQVVRRGEVELR